VKNQDILENQVNKAYLALGSNLGDKKKNLIISKYLISSLGINILKTSSFYESKSWPNKRFPTYINVVILIKTSLGLLELFNKIKNIEKYMGRTKTPKNYPRICDIDIIDFNGVHKNISTSYNEITIPHPRMHKRNFVLIPLYEINKKWIHSKFKKNIAKLISNLSNNDLRGVKIV
tara:strand:+ start:3635 stop:4162 length:528 start_codon:yes stop_codon:yes gene_type:complete